MPRASRKPDWDRLFETAAAQEGHFTTQQAAESGYSPQLLAKYLANGKVERVIRGVYRLVHYPAGEREDMVVVWLWSGRQGVFSHETALALHDLGDALPAHHDLTLPAAWNRRRLRVPRGVRLHYANIPARDRAWFGAVPVTKPARTLRDCAELPIAPEMLLRATLDARRRGLVRRAEIAEVERALAPYVDHVA